MLAMVLWDWGTCRQFSCSAGNRQEFSNDFPGQRHPGISTNKETKGDGGNGLNNNDTAFVMNFNLTSLFT